MEFHENRAKAPFQIFVLMGRWALQSWRVRQTRRMLDRLSDEQLKDVGLRRDDYC
ncbi:DUF1127 domain-containing protein [Scandinavium sp. V105_16]|uniref:DUF1127 domain-containing protein n=1 Tax=Scandinavium lactucae TaxID=3095028 RepID=A0AAJ2VU94_9ENTR|nr:MULTISPECIES: DUF1127 domain-containing protein [unclassified Scandinavium]MDX6021617.1 DUF1127 domain-containing protein [Scandinavium sp. V105_16]MDX6031782.1 DUF1127 domain-containing protein [Scandinavium sp. V105_12]MDX6038700.1 DUF1127 domain-containing protein [Scandinavium sp. V105_6]MDX6049344.1 DUF1127 domain-containing protein [Scandinavium sp. V105_1]